MSVKPQGHFVLDLDGVLLNTVGAICDVLSEDFNTPIRPEHVHTWDWEYNFSFKPEYWKELWQKAWSREVEPYHGANEFIRSLKALGFVPVGLSHRPLHWQGLEPESLAWEAGERDSQKLELEYTIFVQDSQSKAAKVNELWPDARFTLEDNPKNAASLGRDCPGVVTSMLITRPWNSSCIPLTQDWTRVWNYQSILEDLMSGGLL